MRLPRAVRKLAQFPRLPNAVAALRNEVAQLTRRVEAGNALTARALIERIRSLGPRRRLGEAEFQVFSQWGDDGIIQYLLQQVPVAATAFIEFGVQDYRESNTRFLLVNDNWRGLVIDGSADYVAAIQADDISWRHDLTGVAHFITRENINSIIRDAGFAGDLGILSIDIDGNDYWVWEAIDVVDPAIVIIEYNAVFGAGSTVTVPYAADFMRTKAHPSNLYWGASLGALYALAQRKGYVFAGCNSNGNNAYFVKKELSNNIVALSLQEGFVLSRFRESRDRAGHLTFVRGDDRLALIADQRVIDVTSNREVRLGDVPGEARQK
jgi:hypothetical protein